MASKYQLRETMLKLLTRIEEKSGYSHILIDQEIKKQPFSPKDQALLTEVVYGTTQRKITLDYYINTYVHSGKKVAPWVRMLLRMSIYQMVVLDRIPAHAVIHEAVEIAKKRSHKGIGSFVNGVLRNVQRKGVPETDYLTPLEKKISVETSTPQWLVSRWLSMYQEAITTEMCAANMLHKKITVRVQSLKITRDMAMKRLSDDGIQTEKSKFSKDGLIIREGNILRSSLFQEGYMTVQDQSSMLVAEIMKLKNDLSILDCCSAPGGKTTHIAEKMNNTGNIQAYDIQKNKIKRIREKAETLGLTNVFAEQADARTLQEKHQAESFDRVLVDAPCSGFGVIRTKPDIKYHKKEADIYNLANIQLDILNHVSPLVKKNGNMIYSTCTVDKTENENVIQAFLHEHPEYEIDNTFFHELPDFLMDSPGRSEWGMQLFPQSYGTDGFFLTRLIKKQ